MSPGGRRAVSASHDKTLKVWDLEPGRKLRTLQGHFSIVDGVAVSPDRRHAVCTSSDNPLKVWDLETGAAVATFTCDALAVSWAFVDAHRIVAGDCPFPSPTTISSGPCWFKRGSGKFRPTANPPMPDEW